MIELRDYQKEAVASAVDFFSSNEDDRPVIVAPTGSGKSIVIAHTAQGVKDLGGVLVLQPSKELLEQNYAKFIDAGGKAKIYSASMGVKEVGDITFAMIGSIKNNADIFSHVKFVIIDECHFVPPTLESMYVTFLSGVRAKILGLTATPFRLKKYSDPWSGEAFSKINLLTRERPKYFNKFLHITQIGDLYAKGFLCPIKYIELTWDSGSLKLNTTGAEYSDESVDWALKQQKIHERIPDMIRQSIEKGRKHRLVFVKNVADAQMLATKVPDSACIHAETKKKERDIIIKKFRAGIITTIFNVSVLTTGFDFPALDTIIIARPTMSLALYMQMIGRGIRLSPGKEDCAVVDMCGNVSKFSRLEEIKLVQDEKENWVLRDDNKILSGVKMEK